MGYLIFAYLIMSVHLGVESSPFSQILLKKYSQDLVIVSSYDGTYDWIRECEKNGTSILSCNNDNIFDHLESQVRQLGNFGVVVGINGFPYCRGLTGCEPGGQRASNRDVIYVSGNKTITVEFIIYVK